MRTVSSPSHEPNADATDQAALGQLRQLLLSPEQNDIETLRRRLDDPEVRALETARVLPDAIAAGVRQDPRLAAALAPTITEGLRDAVRKDLPKLADALFPIIGPAIRKSIAETFRQLLQSLNRSLEQGLSVRGLKWRLEARRSGKSFAEVVLLHSLVYRVEQVFLIHRDSGLLLLRLNAAESTDDDAGLVSAMLTAIRDFVRDAFRPAAEQGLDAIQFGDLSLWVEQGPHAVIAAAIRGTPPEDLRQLLRRTLEAIHRDRGEALARFDGDPAGFESERPRLETCLQARYRDPESKRRMSPPLAVLMLALAGAVATWIHFDLRDRHRWQDFITRLEAQPGIVVTAQGRRDGGYFVTGLRDPLVPNPRKLLAPSPLDPDRVQLRFTTFQSLDPSLVLARARRVLAPPPSIALTLRDGVLRAAGSADFAWLERTRLLARALAGVRDLDTDGVAVRLDLSALDPPPGVTLSQDQGIVTAVGSARHAWIESARRRVPAVPGLVRYDDGGVRIVPDLSPLAAPPEVELRVRNGVVRARGNADHAWIRRARQLAPTLPGVTRYDDADLRDRDRMALDAAARRLTERLILFRAGAGLDAIRPGDLEGAATDLSALTRQARILGLQPRLRLIGHTDDTGGAQVNLALSQARAETVRYWLVERGFDTPVPEAFGVGADRPVAAGDPSLTDRARNRSVTIEVDLEHPPPVATPRTVAP